MRRGINFVFASLCMLTLFFACAPQVRRETPMPPPTGLQALPPLHLEGLEKKIATLKEFVETKDLTDEEVKVARNLLRDYETVREVLRYPLYPDDYHRIIDLFYDNLTGVDEEYLKTVRRLKTRSPQAFLQRRETILRDFLSENYMSVIEACAEIQEQLEPESFTSDVALLCALSLGESGRYEEALTVSEEISPVLEKKPGLLWLKLKSIDWELALGNQDDALRRYEQLAGYLSEQEEMLKLAEMKVLPPEPAKTMAEESLQEEVATPSVEEPTPTTTDEVLKKAEELVRSGEPAKAEFILYQHRLRLEEGPEAEAVDRALESLEEASTASLQAPEPEGPTVEEILKMVSAFIDGEQYEEALLKLEELKQKKNLTPEGQKLEARAIEKIINRERNKAAELFLRARSASDPAKKEELLRSSYDTLKAVSEKYPDSPLSKKVNDNMRAIENELKKVKRTG